ncbi:MAG TPA: flagellar biosynthetic protein FliQ [Rhodanobacteraceae bacterium]
MPFYEVLLHQAFDLVLLTTLPVIAAILVASLLVGIMQALTQVNDTTISLVSHLIAAAFVLVPYGYWMMTRDAALLSGFAHNLSYYIDRPWS